MRDLDLEPTHPEWEELLAGTYWVCRGIRVQGGYTCYRWFQSQATCVT